MTSSPDRLARFRTAALSLLAIAVAALLAAVALGGSAYAARGDHSASYTGGEEPFTISGSELFDNELVMPLDELDGRITVSNDSPYTVDFKVGIEHCDGGASIDELWKKAAISFSKDGSIIYSGTFGSLADGADDAADFGRYAPGEVMVCDYAIVTPDSTRNDIATRPVAFDIVVSTEELSDKSLDDDQRDVLEEWIEDHIDDLIEDVFDLDPDDLTDEEKKELEDWFKERIPDIVEDLIDEEGRYPWELEDPDDFRKWLDDHYDDIVDRLKDKHADEIDKLRKRLVKDAPGSGDDGNGGGSDGNGGGKDKGSKDPIGDILQTGVFLPMAACVGLVGALLLIIIVRRIRKKRE